MSKKNKKFDNKKKYSTYKPALANGRESEEARVRAKKHLGQHFLKDETVAKQIGDTLLLQGYTNVIEIGPGTGVLTKYLLLKDINLIAMDLDSESIVYLNHTFLLEHSKIIRKENNFEVIEADFLKYDLSTLFPKEQFAITGNFPYNISTQIVFKMLENKERIPEFTGMFQKEVAKRICEKEGNKTYGILSVLAQAFYDATYLFTVQPEVFNPPPKVQSGVLRLVRKKEYTIPCEEKLFYTVVKNAFGQRRKTLRNSLKTLFTDDSLKEMDMLSRRPEQMSVDDFIQLTCIIQKQTPS